MNSNRINLLLTALGVVGAYLALFEPEFRTCVGLDEGECLLFRDTEDVVSTSPSVPLVQPSVPAAIQETPTNSPNLELDTQACPLEIGDEVQAKDGANLWVEPDVINSSFSSLSPNTILEILDEPVLRKVRSDKDCSGWWYKVKITSSGNLGWIWDRRLIGCPDPENFTCD